MVALQSFNETGKHCKKCNNKSVFKKNIYGGFLKLFFKYTEFKCFICEHTINVYGKL